MSDELQTDAGEQPATELPDQQTIGDVSESAPDSGENHEVKVTFSDEQQQLINDLAAKKTFKIREAQRESEELRRQLEEANSKIPQKTRPEIPDIPDAYDDDYEAQLNQRDEAIRAAAKFDAENLQLQNQQQYQQQQQQLQQQQALHNVMNEYSKRATKLGVSEDELRNAGQTINNYGVDDQVAGFILNDPQGPLITKYLASNPMELETLRGLDPISAGIHIATTVKQKAAALGKKQPTAPDPTNTLSGAGVPTKKRGAAGTTFE